MVQIIVAVVAVLFVTAVAVAYLVLVVSDVRSANGEPLNLDAQRSLDAHEGRDGRGRVNKGAQSGGW